MNDISIILKSLEFAAERHQNQFRKGKKRPPYINHPIRVADILANKGEEKDPALLSAALLHDVLEDTVKDLEEKKAVMKKIRETFGEEVLSIVLEVTDDKEIEKAERKRLQIVTAPTLSEKAKKLRIADKIANLLDLRNDPPEGWPVQRIMEYYDWSEKVVAGVRGMNEKLDSVFDATLKEGRANYQPLLQN